MVDLDLDIITGKQKTVRIFGKETRFANLPLKEHFENEALLKELDIIPLTTQENIDKSMKIIQKYLTTLLEIDEETASKVTIDQYKGLKKFLDRKELYDQGFNDKDIDMIEKKQIKTAVSRK